MLRRSSYITSGPPRNTKKLPQDLQAKTLIKFIKVASSISQRDNIFFSFFNPTYNYNAT